MIAPKLCRFGVVCWFYIKLESFALELGLWGSHFLFLNASVCALYAGQTNFRLIMSIDVAEVRKLTVSPEL